MFWFAMTAAITFSRFRWSLRSLRGLTTLLLSLLLIACVGCGDSKVPATPSSTPASTVASPSAETTASSLADIQHVLVERSAIRESLLQGDSEVTDLLGKPKK